jgi:hypothetical protein
MMESGEDARREIATMLRQRATFLDGQLRPENAPTVRELYALALNVERGGMAEAERISVLHHEIMVLKKHIMELEGR